MDSTILTSSLHSADSVGMTLGNNIRNRKQMRSKMADGRTQVEKLSTGEIFTISSDCIVQNGLQVNGDMH